MSKQQIIKYIVILVFGLLAGIYIISAFKSGPDMILYERKLDSLTTLVNNNRKQIQMLDISISQFNIKVNKLDSQNVVYETKINKLTKYANQKIKAVDSFSNDSLFKSLSNRYHK